MSFRVVYLRANFNVMIPDYKCKFGKRTAPSSVYGYFIGLLDDMRIYNHALTQQEITALIPEPTTISPLPVGGLTLLPRKR